MDVWVHFLPGGWGTMREQVEGLNALTSGPGGDWDMGEHLTCHGITLAIAHTAIRTLASQLMKNDRRSDTQLARCRVFVSAPKNC